MKLLTSYYRVGVTACLIGGVGFGWGHDARAAQFNPSASSATFSHIAPPNTQGFSLDTFSVPGDAGWNADPTLTPTPLQMESNVFVNIPDLSIASAGISHYTLPGAAGIGNVSLSYESGVGQDDGDQSTFQGESTLVVAFDMEWDISGGWVGPHYAYQFMGVTLATTGPGDVVSVAADFTYELEVFGEGIDTVDLHYEGMAQDGLTEDLFLFQSKLLRATNVPAAGVEGDGLSFLRISGMWTFTALDPQGPSSATLLNDDQGQLSDFLNRRIDPIPGINLPDEVFALQGGGVANIREEFVTPPDVIPEPGALGVLLAGTVLLLRRRG